MSAFVLDQNEINLLTTATDAALRLSETFPDSYPLEKNTTDLLGKYAGDLHSLYRALYITNIKAVNGRYNEEVKTLPKYKKLIPWNADRDQRNKIKKAAALFGCYIYQISEDPIFGTKVFRAFQDIQKLLCFLVVQYCYGWDGEAE